MKRHLLAPLLVFALLFSSCSPTTPAKSPQERQRDAVIRITATMGMGLSDASGFVAKYRNHTVIITAAHVVHNTSLVWILGRDGKLMEVTVKEVLNPGSNDVSVLLVEGLPKGHPYLELSTDMDLPVTAKCLGIGYKGGNEFSEVEGEIVGFMMIPVGAKMKAYIITDCKLTFGMSGGPLLHKGKVIAVHSAVSKDPNRIRAIHVPIDTVTEMIDSILEEF